MPRVADLLSAYEHAKSPEDAEQALDGLRAASPPHDLELGELYDGLAEAAAESDDFALAVRAERRAVELGCDYPELAREMLAWYLLKAGSKREGEAAFAKLRAERGDDPEVLLALASARTPETAPEQSKPSTRRSPAHAASTMTTGCARSVESGATPALS